MRAVVVVLVAVTASALFAQLEAARPTGGSSRRPTHKQMVLQRKETTPVDFTRLVVMRLAYGVARVLGLEEPASELLGGALVPPGEPDDDDDDDDGGGLFDADDY